MSSEVLIVTAADSRYFALLRDLLLSIADKFELSDVPVAVLDLGMSFEERAWIDARVARCVQPGWDLDFRGRKKAGESYKAHVARPFLPRHFPGYDIYLWLDADTWLQRGEAVEVLVEAARGGSLAICPEADVGYRALYDGTLQRFLEKTYGRSLGPREGRLLSNGPPLNSGVFALRGDAPHWEAWRRALAGVLKRIRDPYVEQTALTKAVYGDRLPARFLPATFNWVCSLGLPAVEEERGRLSHPNPPHDPLHVVHQTSTTKWREHELTRIGGGTVTRSLRYRGGDP